MARIFLSHSSKNNAEAVALRDWLGAQGWKNDLFLDLDPERGIAAGERWGRALHEAASRCEAVLFLVSRAWLCSRWCMKEFNLAHRLNKRLFGLLIEDIPVAELPADLTSTWQLVRLASGRDHQMFRAILPVTGEEAHVTFSADGLTRLRAGLLKAGLDAGYFDWPPKKDPERAPYRGLRPLEAADAGIFFGRGGQIVIGMDMLRGLRDAAPPRLVVILGASGAGKSSFMRAGLLPRLAREDQHFLPLPVIRPERAVITGEAGLVASLEQALKTARLSRTRADIRTAVDADASGLKPLLTALADARTPAQLTVGSPPPKPPTLILPIDQAEELFNADGAKEAHAFLRLLSNLAVQESPALIVLFTIRSDGYEHLQSVKELDGLRQHTLSLPPMPQGAFAEVIKGPARRLERSARPLKIEEQLVDELLSDIEKGVSKDALPLLAFTLEWLYREHGADGDLKLSEYEALGRVKGSIEAAVERALKAADANSAIPRDRARRLKLLRRGFIPWLARLDPETGFPRRETARLSEIPAEAQPLINLLVDQHLLATDVTEDTNEVTVEPAHEALLRQWGQLKRWLTEDAKLLGVLAGVKHASRDWAKNHRDATFLTHNARRLATAERLQERHDLASNLSLIDWDYLAACRKAKMKARLWKGGGLAFVSLIILGVVLGFQTKRSWLPEADVAAHKVLGWIKRAPPNRIKDCSFCPEMVVVPKGKFSMGSPPNEKPRREDEDNKAGDGGDPVPVAIPAPFAVSKFEVTFDQWDACVDYGGCTQRASDPRRWGRDKRPVIDVSWNDAQEYVKWLRDVTGKTYRLLSEAEWEYAARAESTTRYSFEDEASALGEHAWYFANSGRKTQSVGNKKPNDFGLYDMHGNVREWVEDCYQTSHMNQPGNGLAVLYEDCDKRVLRGGNWQKGPEDLRSASRHKNDPDTRSIYYGFRVARALSQLRLNCPSAECESRQQPEPLPTRMPTDPPPAAPRQTRSGSPPKASKTASVAGHACTQYGMVKYCVSSVHEPEEDNAGLTATYGPEQLNDGALPTAWVEGKRGDGEGEWVRVDFGGPRWISALQIYNGYQKRDDVFRKNGRVQDIEIVFSNGRSQKATLVDRMGPQTIHLGPDINAEWVQILIRSVYKGSKYDDTAITELSVTTSSRKLSGR